MTGNGSYDIDITDEPGDWTVAHYLAARLNELGITHLFGVPGNHLGPFLTTLRKLGQVEWVGTPTENGAGHAADAYARIHGVGAAAVTYSVGAFSLLNAIGGAYVEYVPIIAINSSPTYEQWLNLQAVGLLTTHMSPRTESNLDVYRQVTVDAQVISNPGIAPAQIDAALTACLSERRPVYLEIMEDIWDAPCAPLEGRITRRERPVTHRNAQMLATAVDAAVTLIKNHERKPILWAGEEIDRFRLGREFTELVQKTRIPYCTTIGAKAVVSEDTPGFVGVYNGNASDPRVHHIFKEWAKCRIGLGSWPTSPNLSGDRSMGTDWAMAVHGGVSVGTTYYPDITLARFIPALRTALVDEFGEGAFEADYFTEASAAGRSVPESAAAYQATLSCTTTPEKLTWDSFFGQINAFLLKQEQEQDVTYSVVADAGFSMLGSMNLHMHDAGGYLAQNNWLSIGYSVGAATGAGFARPAGRQLVFVGDGAFQETCLEVSTHTRHRLRPVIFVFDNEGFYGIEQMLVNPCYFKDGGDPSDGADHYNILHPWHYSRLARVFHGDKTPITGEIVHEPSDLDEILDRIADPTDPINEGPALIHVHLKRHDFPRALSYKLADCP